MVETSREVDDEEEDDEEDELKLSKFVASDDSDTLPLNACLFDG